MNDEELHRRALAAYFRSGGNVQPQGGPKVHTLDGRVYVVLATGSDILAIYRLRNDGLLRRLRRYPEKIVKKYQ